MLRAPKRGLQQKPSKKRKKDMVRRGINPSRITQEALLEHLSGLGCRNALSLGWQRLACMQRMSSP